MAVPTGGLSAPTLQTDVVVAITILGILGTGLAYVLNYRIIQDDGAVMASVVTYLLPVVAIGLGWLVLGETIGLTSLIGAIAVLAGVGISRISSSGQEPEVALTS